MREVFLLFESPNFKTSLSLLVLIEKTRSYDSSFT